MRTDMEFMNRLFHAVLRRDLERAIGSLTASRHRSPSMWVWYLICFTITTPVKTSVCGHSSGAGPPTSVPNWT